MNKVRLVASDLDGTLLNNNRTISDYTKETIDELFRNGITFIPCTGRDFPEVPEYLKKHNKIEYIISGNGSKITNNKNGSTLCEFNLLKEDVYQVFDLIGDVSSLVTVSIDGILYITPKLVEALEDSHSEFKTHILNTRVIVDDLNPLIEQAPNGVQKLHFGFTNPEQRLEMYDKLKKIEHVSTTSSHPSNIEVTHKNATKGNALSIVADLLEIPFEQRIAFGDNDNDVSMMKVVKFGIAMGNATEELKKYATHTAENNHEDGVAKIPNNYVLAQK